MIKKANIQWTAKQLCKMMEKGTVTFENSVQRGLVWDIKRKSLLIHSMMVGYPIPAFYAAKSENGYDLLDGKQRSNAISDFVNGKFELTDIPDIKIEQGFEDYNGDIFENLPEDLKDEILGYSLTCYFFTEIDEEEINEMFFRLNNGKPLTAIEITRVKAKSLEKIKEIGKHELFNTALSAKALTKYTHEDIVIKAWTVLFNDDFSLETKDIRPLMESIDITDTQAETISKAFTRILDAHKSLIEYDTKESIKAAKRLLTRTHLVSCIPVALQSIEDDISFADFGEFIGEFFAGKKSSSINDEYNYAAGSGSAKAENVQKRIEILKANYNKKCKLHKVA